MNVSIVIPAFNALRWLPETLASAASQSLAGLEIIVVDDGSTDGTGDFVTRTNPHVRLIRTDNRGCSAARSLGAEQARGEYIKYLDADDLLLPGMVERQVKLARETGADVVYGNWQRKEERLGRWVLADEVRRRIEDVDADPEVSFFTSMWCPTGAYLWRTEFLRLRHPGWHPQLPVIQDARFALDAARVGARFVHDSANGILYRVHQSGSVSTRSRLAFLQDCRCNANEIERAWCAGGQLAPSRRQALLRVWSHVTRGAFQVDFALFKECWNHLQGLAPGFIPPGGKGFNGLARVLGYPRAEAIAARIRWAKRVFTK